MEKTNSELENFIKIKTASVMVGNAELFFHVSKFIEYRQKVAIEMLNIRDENAYKILQNTYEMCEYELKKILGL